MRQRKEREARLSALSAGRGWWVGTKEKLKRTAPPWDLYRLIILIKIISVKCTILVGTLIAGETVHECLEWRQVVYGKSLYLLSNFAVDLTFSSAPKSLQMVTAAMKLKDAYSLEERL